MVGVSDKSRSAEGEKDGRADAMTSGGARVSSKNGSSSEEFDRALAKVAVVQVCESMGFQGLQKSATEILTDIAIRYLTNLAKSAHSYANLASRTQCNALDVILALEDLGTGPRSVTEPSRPLSASSALRDVMKYVDFTDEIPFARPVPRFPVSKKRAPSPSFLQLGETPPFSHIPPWLPAFPDAHTYKSTPVWNERTTDLQSDQREQAKQRRKAERSLMSLHLRLASSGDGIPAHERSFFENRGLSEPAPGVAIPADRLAGPSSVRVAGDRPVVSSRQQWPSREQEQQQVVAMLEAEQLQNKGKGKKTPDAQNPFLAQPLAPGEIDVSRISLPKLGVDELASRKVTLPSALQAFAPALEGADEEHVASTSLDFSAFGALPDAKDRAPVHLTFDWGRKTRAKAAMARLTLGLADASSGKGKAHGIVGNGKDEEKDDKRKRVEQILAQAMDGMDNEPQA